MNNISILHFSLNQHINYQDGSVVSREIFKNQSGTVTLFAFAKGQGLSEHKTLYDAFVFIIDGEADIIISGILNKVKAGEIIHMPADIPHALKAKQQFKMLLTMMKKK
ncbi:cupin domain-containing protein [Candidatus Roizmanbacteria bacterium CG_4_10_14_0_8_um_filter_39_9]|uniref:Cupin domain-containing protein n=1 Tax=Candidatus Roizmanbacteria bacterium CG_4_10_14_0_8_um_filter_39_9 TaxID=1974829 RepID=A0A2M7QCP0_9BACT|nr:MAG: cupin domain-containing protein [Candidatus Roizmanbacteria bacterium CG_4_10_14_0_8_um_filter_39_9]